MSETKRRWIKPQLVILGKGTPEERVLAACKTTTSNAPGPNGKTCNTAPGNCLANLVS